MESLRRTARRKMGLDNFQKRSNLEESAFSNTESVEHRLREFREERKKSNPKSSFVFDVRNGYSDDVILADPRLALESAMREAGLLSRNNMLDYGLTLVDPPTKPRPDMTSQIEL